MDHFLTFARRLLSWPIRHWRIVLICLIVLVIVHTVADQILLRKLAKQREDLRAAGYAVSLNEFALTDLAEDDNAATVYRYAASLLEDPGGSGGGIEELLQRYVNAHLPACAHTDRTGQSRGGLADTAFSNDEEALVDRFMILNERMYASIEEGCAKPACQFGDYGSPMALAAEPAAFMPEFASLRQLGRMAAGRAVWEARRGNAAGAYGWLAKGLHLANDLENDPLLIAGTVRCALVGLTAKPLQAVLDMAPPAEPFPPKLLAELDRVRDRAMLSRFFAGERCFSNAMSQHTAAQSGRWTRPYVMTPNQIRINNLLTEIIALVAEPSYARRQAALRRLETEYPSRKNRKVFAPWRILADIMVPALLRSTVAFERMIAQADGARLAIALRQYGAAHGAYPETLDALVPEHIEALPEDPFSGEDFQYAREGEGFVVHSVGEGGKNRGGGGAASRHQSGLVWCVSP